MYLFYAQQITLDNDTECFIIEKKEDNRWKVIATQAKLKEGDQTNEKDIETIGETITEGLFVSFASLISAVKYSRIYVRTMKMDIRIIRCIIPKGNAWSGTDAFRDKNLYGCKQLTKIDIAETLRK